jgi:serine protease Do
MKKLFFVACMASLLGNTAVAQVEQKDVEILKEKEQPQKKETQEIIIRKKGGKDFKVIIETKDNKITINGKPLADYKDDEITISKRNIIIRGRNGKSYFDMDPADFGGFSFGDDDNINNANAFLGVSTKGSDDEDGENKFEGAKIIDVTKGSAAEKAGLQQDDIIKKINDTKINNPKALVEIINNFKPKETITVYYTRNGKENNTKVTLGNKLMNDMVYNLRIPKSNMRKLNKLRQMPMIDNINGLQQQPPLYNFDFNMDGDIDGINIFGEGYSKHKQKLGIKIQDVEEGNGVKILEAEKDSPAEKAGLLKDDVITEIGGEKINNTDDARLQLAINKQKSNYNIKVNRNGKPISIDVKIPKKLKTAEL